MAAAVAALTRQALYGEPDVPLLERLIPRIAAVDSVGAGRLLVGAKRRLADAIELYPGEGDFQAKLERLERIAR